MSKSTTLYRCGPWAVTSFGLENERQGYYIGKSRLNETRTENDQAMSSWLLSMTEKAWIGGQQGFDQFYKCFLAALDRHKRPRTGACEPLELAKTREYCLRRIEDGQAEDKRFHEFMAKRRPAPNNPFAAATFSMADLTAFDKQEAGR